MFWPAPEDQDRVEKNVIGTTTTTTHSNSIRCSTNANPGARKMNTITHYHQPIPFEAYSDSESDEDATVTVATAVLTLCSDDSSSDGGGLTIDRRERKNSLKTTMHQNAPNDTTLTFGSCVNLQADINLRVCKEFLENDCAMIVSRVVP